MPKNEEYPKSSYESMYRVESKKMEPIKPYPKKYYPLEKIGVKARKRLKKKTELMGNE